jgi:hypothetical protein
MFVFLNPYKWTFRLQEKPPAQHRNMKFLLFFLFLGTIFSPLFFVAVFGSRIRDIGSEIRDLRSGIRDGRKSESGIRDKHPGSATVLLRLNCSQFETMQQSRDITSVL